MNYSFTDKAEQDLEGIIDYTANRWGKVQAERYIEQLQQTLNNLVQNPETARSRPELSSGLYSFPFQSHISYFQKSDSRLTITRILHCSMDTAKHF